MRRYSVLLLAAVALGALMTMLCSYRLSGPLGIAHFGLQSMVHRVVDRVIDRSARVSGRVADLVVPSANAQQVLEFKTVPPESVSRLERRRIKRIPSERLETIEPDVPEKPDVPETPDAPSSPSLPSVRSTGDIMRIGSDVHVERDQVVSGDLLAVGGDITVDGHVEGDVVAMGGDVQLNSTARVDGDVACMGGTLTEAPGASVGGQRVTAGGVRAMSGWREHSRDQTRRAVRTATHVMASMIWLLILLGIAWAFTHIAPGRTAAGLATLRRETALSIGIGALVWALIVPSVIALCLVVVILCITIIGIPIAIAALFGYALFLGLIWVWGYVISAAAIGGWVLNRRRLATAGAIPPAPGPPVATPLEPSLAHKAIIGVLVVSGIGFAGEMLKTVFFIPPLQGFGTFLRVISIVGGGLAATFGAGAWLRTEIASGTLKRWWQGRRPFGGGSQPAAIPATPVASGGIDPGGAMPSSPPAPASPPPSPQV